MPDGMNVAAPADKGEPLAADAEKGEEPEEGDDTYEVDEDTDVITLIAYAGDTRVEVKGNLPENAQLVVTAYEKSEMEKYVDIREA